MRLAWLPEAVDELSYLPPQMKKRMRQALARIADDVKNARGELNIKLLDSEVSPPLWRARVGPWRGSYQVHHDCILIVHIKHRTEGYGWIAEME